MLSIDNHAEATHKIAETKIFKRLAKELTEELDRSIKQPIDCLPRNKSHQPNSTACRNPGKIRIALHPFNKQKIPVPITLARQFNERLLMYISRRASNRYEFMSRTDLPIILEDRDAWSNIAENPINKLWSESANIDVLVSGDIQLEDKTVLLSYKANGMNGMRLATTGYHKILLTTDQIGKPEEVFPLEKVIAIAIENLADQAHDMETLLLSNIVFQNSGSAGPFGHYLQDRLSSAFQNKFSNIITERRLQVFPWSKKRQDKLGTYTLRGKFWDLSDAIELRISLRNNQNEVVSWRGWIRPDTIRQPLRPKGDFSKLRDNDGLGPFAFHVTSDRGLNPVYQNGDYLNIQISLDNGASVYCFTITADKRSKQLFPNPFYWKKNNSPYLSGGKITVIPDEAFNTYPFNLRISGPPGPELIKCFATSRDVTEELPKELRGKEEGLLPRHMVPQIGNYFHQLDNVAISEASFVITIKDGN